MPGGKRVLGIVAGVWWRFLVKEVPASVVGEPGFPFAGNFTCSKCFPFFFTAAVLLDGDWVFPLEDHPCQEK